MRVIQLLICALLFGGTTAIGGDAVRPSSHQLAAFGQAIRELYDLKEKAWAAGDAETIVTRFYAQDAV